MVAAANGPAQEQTGAVMVVGGGIAGIQSSLDLAESGYKVYLVEKRSALGGHMAKLDKTFPTNDCAMCTISPRLVDVASHPNIEILTDSEVAALKGEAGAFKATLHIKPRFIATDICNGCGKCAEVCPESLPSLFDEGLRLQRAAYRLYPQATPDAYAIEKRGVAPCRDACPAGQRAQGYIALVREGRTADALRTIQEDNPFPGICGRICDHRCESACSRGKVDEPLNIRGLKRFVVDREYARPRVAPAPAERRHEERIAIIGAGPCGLTAAQDLLRHGYGVTVFEALPAPGGMLRFGVPAHRLPAGIIEREIQDILDLGVDLRLNTRVDNLDELFAQGFKAVLIAVGAQEGIRLPIPGNDLNGVIINTHFLRDVRLAEMMRAAGDAPSADPRALIEGKDVVVVGGGDVAVDVARSALRLGAHKVHMAVRGSSGSMPASAHEQKAAREEGIVIEIGLNFLRVIDDGAGRVAGLECERVRFEPDANGRRTAVTVPDSKFVIPGEVLIFSVGQRVGLGLAPADSKVHISRDKTLEIDTATMATGRPGVFAAGDCTTGTAFAIEAIAGGHKSAEAIHRYLRKGAAHGAEKPVLPVAEMRQEDLDRKVQQCQIIRSPRVPMPEMTVATRCGDFAEVELGYSEEQAKAEAGRCLSCGICSECNQCVYACGIGAIDHAMVEETRDINVGAVVLAPGYQTYRAQLSEEYGYGRYPNVVTSLEFERLLSASGPNNGHVLRPSDRRTPKRIAFLQCVGSRDQSHDYCSAVCCMYAAKEAVQAIEHEPDTKIRVFMMDTRAFSKGYEAYYRSAREKYGIGYTRCRISALREDPATRNLLVRYWDRAGAREVTEEEFDMVVLSVGMEIAPEVRDLGRRLGVELDDHGFCRTVQFDPLQTSRRGVFAVGPFREPKDIPESLVDASGAAASIGELLSSARGTLTRKQEYPPERDVSSEEARTAVFVCHCGTNISGFLNCDEVAEYAKTLPGVIHAEESLYACSRDSVAHIADTARELGANRLIVASCTPLTHEGLFRGCARSAGFNPFLVDMANIRNQCSWVHSKDRGEATAKAKDLVRMSAARAAELKPLKTGEMAMNRSALVVGGGPAGMTVALSLARQGFAVHLVEKQAELGGALRQQHFGLDDIGVASPLGRAGSGAWVRPQALLAELVAEVEAEPRITVHRQTVLAKTSGFMGNFTSTLTSPDGAVERAVVQHGAAVLATGGVEYRGEEYGYGRDPRILTQSQFEEKLAAGEVPGRVVMIQCVGPAERYCARICCTTALKNALILKARQPSSEVTVIYKDIRTYGFKERLYDKALEAGVRFVHYDEAHVPEVSSENGRPVVRVFEEILGKALALTADYLVLSTPLVPPPAARELSSCLKVPIDADGFFLEAHVKLRPVDFLSEGLYMAGTAHYPKSLEETLVHARAAAARAGALISHDSITVGGSIAEVDPALCVGCLTCVRSCAYSAPRINPELCGVGGIIGAAYIEPALCQGCGLCAAQCPANAIQLRHYTDLQVRAKVDALFERFHESHAP
ncbi:MAG: FAD-dependent oxidoreductase [Alphaproteobacteria bacterium]|nr:FAD-dependent oxidoreductase [Alphaproteobacteria bacterium]MDE2011489.1 FAD-dependent oxidoreductase [Alphaproteobacteria bacterium]